jgi:hypothetical protein
MNSDISWEINTVLARSQHFKSAKSTGLLVIVDEWGIVGKGEIFLAIVYNENGDLLNMTSIPYNNITSKKYVLAPKNVVKRALINNSDMSRFFNADKFIYHDSYSS